MKKILIILLLTTVSCVAPKKWIRLYVDEVETYEFVNYKDSSVVVSINDSNIIHYFPNDKFWKTHQLKRIIFKDVE